MPRFNKGHSPWNKNKTYEELYGKEKADNIKEKQSKKAKENIKNGIENAFSKGKKHSKYWLGKKHSEETIEKIRKNRYNPMENPENRRKISQKLKGKIPKNLELINKNKSGSGNPMWMGGLSYKGYDNKWNRKFRHLIRKRDNFICLLCGKHQEKEGKSLSVHHINYDKKLSIKENCITLCSDCHKRTNKNRNCWINLFQNLLKDKFKYGYYEDNKPIINMEIDK